jgi:hypothetical protein
MTIILQVTESQSFLPKELLELDEALQTTCPPDETWHAHLGGESLTIWGHRQRVLLSTPWQELGPDAKWAVGDPAAFRYRYPVDPIPKATLAARVLEAARLFFAKA